MQRFASILLVVTTMCLSNLTRAQDVYQHVTNSGIYEFVDELANLGIISVNSSVKPYSRKTISNLLQVAHEQRETLNRRQQQELDFYLKDFGKELQADKNFNRRFDVIYYKDSLFSLTINPVVGVNTFSNGSTIAYRRWVGAEVFGYVGNHWAMYASLRDYNENHRLADRPFLNQYKGGGYKRSGTGGEFSEMRGGVSYGWSWGSIGLIKDHMEWGSGYNGTNILYSKAPSFAMLKLNIKPAQWFELNFLHGWLVSEVIDSSRSYIYAGSQRDVMHPKYIAANFATLTPIKGLNISVGNSIIYSDMDIHPAYLTPLFFYKSIDHHLNGMSNYTGQNSQMFADLSVRLVKNTHLYATLFLDELSMKRMFQPDKHSNFFSIKGGGRTSNILNANISITAEYTRNNPQVFEHIIGTTTFESNGYNLGHYLRENAQDIYLSVDYRPIKNVLFSLSYTNAQKGPDTSTGISRWGLVFLDEKDWQAEIISTKLRYQIMHDGYFYVGVDYAKYEGNIAKYTPTFLTKEPITITFGGSYGF